MKNIQVYFRKDENVFDEFNVCKETFSTVENRTKLIKLTEISTVICRYSALPFYKELEEDLKEFNAKPINSYLEHSYIADMGWVYDLENLTFPTWFRLEDIRGDFPLVVKGKTNSRKFEWKTKMFAQNKREAIDIMCELMHDPLIGPQGVVFRKYIPLQTYEIGINDMPMTNEWRCFFYKNKLVDCGFYWSTLDDLNVVDTLSFEKEGKKVAQEAANIVCDNATFFVIDVAQGIDGKWWIVEVNDGQMSGLSTIPIKRFYQNLKEALK